ncbi:transporter family-2 protein [Loktanella sp. DSM 29012]|uniref:DMT family transporter n=1 Tax=Loktanella gaetbuli TaxID=2881335 RepID=A0ABS8BWR1_9RHOB|nr:MULTISPECIES: DMT family transporter [Loktanella]MCB5200185.1 DMT family transporter [Loktanella gaetbuli]SEP81280.1 transporter family-2 protein [Loktanella sp. DSM 29012]
MTDPTQSPTHPLAFLAAFGAGGLLSLMVLFNGTLAQYGSLLFSSWVPHATGTVAALIALAILRPGRTSRVRPPLWSYAGGLSGAVTVMATSYALNTPLALSGTLAIGLAGQMVFSLIADARGLFGLRQRMPSARDMAALALIVTGSLVLIFLGGAA